MEYIFVEASDKERIQIVYTILKKCGWKMAKQFLFHWIPPYSKKAIRSDCKTKQVVLVWDEKLQAYTSTFQMYISEGDCLFFRKIATLPEYEGRGIGRSNLRYIEDYARERGCSKLCLDVYVKSKAAVDFYLHNGFTITGTKRSIRFKEYLMEKAL